jgi:hypothetical protein
MMLTLHRDLTTPTPTKTCPNAISDATGDFIFLVLPYPKIKGAEWGGGAQQQQQRKSAATAAAAAARTRGNEINSAMRSNALLTCRLVVF